MQFKTFLRLIIVLLVVCLIVGAVYVLIQPLMLEYEKTFPLQADAASLENTLLQELAYSDDTLVEVLAFDAATDLDGKGIIGVYYHTSGLQDKWWFAILRESRYFDGRYFCQSYDMDFDPLPAQRPYDTYYFGSRIEGSGSSFALYGDNALLGADSYTYRNPAGDSIQVSLEDSFYVHLYLLEDGESAYLDAFLDGDDNIIRHFSSSIPD